MRDYSYRTGHGSIGFANITLRTFLTLSLVPLVYGPMPRPIAGLARTPKKVI